MKCPKCSAKLDDGSTFCGECGAPVEKVSTDAEVAVSAASQPAESVIPEPLPPASAQFVPPSTDPVASVQPKPKKKTGMMLAGVVLLLVLGLGGAWAALGELPVLGSFPLAQIFPFGSHKDIEDLIPAGSDMYMKLTMDGDAEQINQA